MKRDILWRANASSGTAGYIVGIGRVRAWERWYDWPVAGGRDCVRIHRVITQRIGKAKQKKSRHIVPRRAADRAQRRIHEPERVAGVEGVGYVRLRLEGDGTLCRRIPVRSAVQA